jgi:DNA-binding phage protein
MTLDEIEQRLRTDAAFRMGFIALLVRAGLVDDRKAKFMARCHAAAVMLASGVKRNEGQAQLQERYGISRRAAYRALDKALEIKQGTLF